MAATGYYDPNKDYSLAIKNATSDAEIKQLQTERQNKIDAVYGGKDPYTTDTVNKTTGKATTATNTASKYYDSDWTPQTATVQKNVEYNAKQGVAYTPDPVEEERVAASSAPDFSKLLSEWLAAAQKQQTAQIDYATNQGILELQRAQQDAEGQYQEQRNQVAIDEAKAKDNQALYAEARGDRGGIGAAQYDQIMATAAQNRLAVNQAQTKMATDTARQIADLRAQGEFEKADALLSLSQQYLSQLISLEQWALEYNLSVQQLQQSMDQWEAEFKMAEAGITGMYNGAPTLQYQQYQTETLAEQGWMFLNAGIPPTESQLAAMGISASQAQDYITAVKLAAAAKGSGGDKTEQEYVSINTTMRNLGIKDVDEAYAYLISKGYTDTEADRISDSYGSYLKSLPTVNSVYGNVSISDFGTEYNNAVTQVRRMFDNNKSQDDIIAYLEKFTDKQLTDAGVAYILQTFGIQVTKGG